MEKLSTFSKLDDNVPIVKKSSEEVGASGDAPDQAAEKIPDPQGTQQQVMEQVQELMQELENKREADKQMVEEFRSRLHEMVEQLSQQVEERLLNKHQETNKQVEVKLQYLNEIVGRVCGLESELFTFKNAISCLFNDLQS